MHLIFDGFGANRKVLESKEFVYDLLDRYPSRIGMTKVSQPQVYRYVGTKPEDWGISGFVVIAESHISIHTFPERRYANIDIFSCKDFDPEQAIRELNESFGFNEIKTHLLMRGLQDAPIETAEVQVN